MLRIAVLGCGRIGQMHAANVARHPRATLPMVYDIDSAAAAAVAEDLPELREVRGRSGLAGCRGRRISRGGLAGDRRPRRQHVDPGGLVLLQAAPERRCRNRQTLP